MAFRLGEIFTELTVRGAGTMRSTVRGVKSDLQAFGSTAKTITAASAALFAGTAGAARKFIDLAGAQIESERKLESVLRATGGAAQLTAEQIKIMAGDLQKTTGIGDEVIITAQAMLATFKEIKGETFERTTKAMVDMSVIMGTDLKQSALQLGKALNEPLTGMTALRRSGVSFTKEQTELLKKLVKTNKLAKAQSVILAEVERQFGGAAEAVGTTFTGQLTLFENALADVGELIGFTLIRNLNEFLKVGNNELIPFLQKAFGRGGVGDRAITNTIQGFDALIDLVRGAAGQHAVGATKHRAAGTRMGGFTKPRTFMESIFDPLGEIGRTQDFLGNQLSFLFGGQGASPAIRGGGAGRVQGTLINQIEQERKRNQEMQLAELRKMNQEGIPTFF